MEFPDELEFEGYGFAGGNWFDDIGHDIRHASHKFGTDFQHVRSRVRHGLADAGRSVRKAGDDVAWWYEMEDLPSFLPGPHNQTANTNPNSVMYSKQLDDYCKGQFKNSTDQLEQHNKQAYAQYNTQRQARIAFESNMQHQGDAAPAIASSMQGQPGSDPGLSPYSSGLDRKEQLQQTGGSEATDKAAQVLKHLAVRYGLPAAQRWMANQYKLSQSAANPATDRYGLLHEARFMKNMSEPNWASYLTDYIGISGGDDEGPNAPGSGLDPAGLPLTLKQRVCGTKKCPALDTCQSAATNYLNSGKIKTNNDILSRLAADKAKSGAVVAANVAAAAAIPSIAAASGRSFADPGLNPYK